MPDKLKQLVAVRDSQPPVLVIYGVAGIGKTTLASKAPAPIFIPVEDGLGKLKVPSFEVPEKFTDVLDAVVALGSEKHEYQTVVLDSLSALQPIIWQHCADEHGLPSFSDFSYGKGYALAAEAWRKLLAGLLWLRGKGMTIIMVAHNVVEKYQNPSTEPYDRHNVRLHETGDGRGGARPLVFDAADAVLFCDYEVTTKTTEGEWGKERVRPVGNGERIVYTSDRPVARAKNRFGMPDKLPMKWEAIAKYL